ncbi:MAG: hypothetical protein AABW59_03090 [archaeon]
MEKYVKWIVALSALLTLLSGVFADIVSGPEVLVVGVVGIVILVAAIVVPVMVILVAIWVYFKFVKKPSIENVAPKPAALKKKK